MRNKKYQIIYVDPPWKYKYSKSNNRKIENHYNTMELEKIKKLEIPADKNCILYMWTTAPKLSEAIEIIKEWGFNYKSCLIWDKKIMGLGYWFRIQHEILLVGVKGIMHPPKPQERINSIIKIKRGQHSSKPDYIREMINKWYPDYSKIELFARKTDQLFDKFNGWDIRGDEV